MEGLTSPWQVLVGFWDEDTALDYVRSQGLSRTDQEFEGVKAEIAIARTHVAGLADSKKDRPEIRSIDGSERKKLKPLESESTFKEHLRGINTWEFAWVELAKLLTFQPNLNTAYIESLREKAPKPEDTDGLFRFCLPLSKEAITKETVAVSFNEVSNIFSIVTENLDFRILGQVQGQEPESGRRFVGFLYGGGLPQMSVAEYKGRYLMKNGYHRAFALYQAGHTFLPCLLVHTKNYANTGAQKQGFFPLDTMLSDRPPRLEDFTSPAAVAIPRRLLRVVITVQAGLSLLPV